MAVDSLQQRAEQHLRVIRGAMERAGSFTAIPGAGGVLMGTTALVAAVVAHGRTDGDWLAVWLVDAAVAMPLGAVAMVRKARRAGVDLLVGPARQFVFSLAPPIVAGAFLTAALVAADAHGVLPALWLSLYGAATVAGGMLSVRPVPLMGAGFLALGAIAAFAPPATGNWLMGAGFGLLHLFFGAWIWREYGG